MTKVEQTKELVLMFLQGLFGSIPQVQWVKLCLAAEDMQERSTALGVVLNWVLATCLLLDVTPETADEVTLLIRQGIEEECGPIEHEHVKLATAEIIYPGQKE